MGKMSETLRETIKSVVRKHLKKHDGLALGQCLTAVGWVGGTLPELYENDGMIELSMADVAGAGFAVGAGLVGRRPIYIIRYQGFNWFNAPIIINYACKSKEIWGIPCPMFVRSIGMEGAIGPVAGSSHHSIYHRMPGVKIKSPMTPLEYNRVYEEFMSEDEVYYVSEHRGSYANSDELENIYFEKPNLCLFCISITRFAAVEVSKYFSNKGIKISVHHIVDIKPLILADKDYSCAKESQKILVLDDDYENGIARNIASEIHSKTRCEINTLGLKDKTAGFHPRVDNLPPSKQEIIERINSLLSLN